ncbi:hypothetical protein [Kangiella sp.]|uniref:hypothetical protein n=1 Tax=Kangiella sp. TaxID=1920245 RepID=UPI003A90ECD3
MYRPLLAIVLLGVILSGCDQESATTETNNSNQPEVKPQSTTNNQPALPMIELAELPATVNLDPCQLLSKAELNEIGLPDKQHFSQYGWSRQIPNHSPITPFIACKWRSVDQGTPVGWIQVQQIKGEVEPQGEERYSLGEAAWKGTFEGRDQLIIKTGGRLVMVVNQIPYNNKSEMESNIWIAEKVLSRLQEISDSTQPQSANISLLGGPSLDMCKVSNAAKPYELLQGDVAWAIPRIEINHTPSLKERPQEDGVACTYSSDRRGSVTVTYLGNDGVKRWNSYFEKNGDQEMLSQYSVVRQRNRLYIPLEKGAIMIEARGIRYSDEEIAHKFNDIALELLNKLSS